MKSLSKNNKMLFRTWKKYVLRHEINNIKKIKAKSSKKRRYSSSNISSSDLHSGSYLSSDTYWEELRQPTERKETNILDRVVTNNINKDKNQHNDAIGYELRFDNKFSLSSGTKYTLRVVTG